MRDISANSINRYGSANFATPFEIAKADMFKQTPDSLFIGFCGRRRIYYSGAGGVLLTAGARGGKLRDLLSYNLLPGTCTTNIVCLDMKGELGAISQDQTPDGKFCIYWNALRLHDLPHHRINPVDFLTADSPSLISDVKGLCLNLIPPSGSAQGIYFEGRAREVLEGVIVTLVHRHGVLLLKHLYDIINLIPGGGEKWLDFAYEMASGGYALSARVEEEIAASHESEAGGFKGILGEVFRAVSPLSDPVLMASVSPPFDFSFVDLCQDEQTYQVYLQVPAEVIDAWAPILKMFFVGAMVHKARSPSAPRQTWILDECAQLGGFPLIVKLFTYGAGIGIRPLAVYQSLDQLKATAPDAQSIIPASAACRIHFAIRDIGSATALAQMLGVQTLLYDDEQSQAAARHAKAQAVSSMMNGQDPMAAMLTYRHQQDNAHRQTKQQRQLRTADEVLATPDNRSYIFADGLAHPIYAERKAYWTQRGLHYFPNPYHGPQDKVRVKAWIGTKWRKVVERPVEKRFAHYPQYATGLRKALV